MTKSLSLTDPSATELLGCAKGVQPVTMSTQLRKEIVDGLGAPVVVPPGNLEAQVRAAAAAAGYTKCIYRAWDWTKASSCFVQTCNDAQGPLGPNGIVVISFVPVAVAAVNGSVSVTEYSIQVPPGLGSTRKTSISPIPCDYSQGPPWTKVDYNAGIQFTVAPYSMPRVMPTLAVGVQYFLNVANVWPAGGMPAGSQPEIRVNATRPPLV